MKYEHVFVEGFHSGHPNFLRPYQHRGKGDQCEVLKHYPFTNIRRYLDAKTSQGLTLSLSLPVCFYLSLNYEYNPTPIRYIFSDEHP